MAFLTIVIAAITSIFVARAGREQVAAEAPKEGDGAAAIHGRFDDLDSRFDRLETMLTRQTDT